MKNEKTIDVKKIMEEIELAVSEKMMNKEYAKDIDKMKRIATTGSTFSTEMEKHFNDMYTLTFIKKTSYSPPEYKKRNSRWHHE